MPIGIRKASHALTPLRGPSSERGIALLAAVGFLILMGLIVGGLLLTVHNDRELLQQTLGQDQALNVAEAGVAEAMERIRSGDVPAAFNPRMVAQIYLCGATDLPHVGPDSVALATWQNPGGWLSYSTPAPGDEALTVRFKTDASRRKIYRFDETRKPAIQTLSGAPIYVITSTGQQGESRQTVVAEVARPRMRMNEVSLWGAVASGGDVHLQRGVQLCGHNHRADAPPWTGLSGRTTSPMSCDEDLATGRWETGPQVDDRYAAWAVGDISPESSGMWGSPHESAARQPGFYEGCWEALGMSRSDFFTMLGPGSRGRVPKRLQGIVHYSGDAVVGRCDGEGLLYVEGDLRVHGEFTFRGLVYATGRITVDGPCWVLGAMIAGQEVKMTPNHGACTVLYSRDAVESTMGRYATRFVRLSWREG